MPSTRGRELAGLPPQLSNGPSAPEPAGDPGHKKTGTEAMPVEKSDRKRQLCSHRYFVDNDPGRRAHKQYTLLVGHVFQALQAVNIGHFGRQRRQVAGLLK